MSASPSIKQRYERVKDRVANAAGRVGRPPDEITIVAVAKAFPAPAIAEAIAVGVTDVGENRAQELREKHAVLGGRVRWHFVGPLQTNKVRHVVGVASLVHSVDRIALGQAIARRARALGTVGDVLIEVNVAGEPSKHGVEPAAALSLAREVDALDGISVRGLMTIPPLEREPESARPFFTELARLRDVIAAEIPTATALSMGMSNDFEIAIEEGATIVRIGEAIFGPRRV